MVWDAIGLAAGVFVILAFHARRPGRLRGYAIASNVLFLAWALPEGLWPVAVLHAVLLPLNVARLREVREG